MTTPPTPTSEPQDTTCHIVRLVVKGTKNTSAQCDTLDADTVESVRDLAAIWRDPKHSAKLLRSLCDRQQLRGLVAWFQKPESPLEPPPALSVPIEPLLLDEQASPLADICGIEQEVNALGVRPSPRLKWMLVRVGIPAAVLLPQLFNGLIQISVSRSKWIVWLWAGLFLSMIMTGVLMWTLSDQWLIVPGGVVVRRSLFRNVGQKLTRYTPADTMLFIRVLKPGFSVELWRGETVKQRRATHLEVTALLAAWQSPLPAPDVARLSDFE